MFDGISRLGLLQTHKHIREAIAAETRVYTLTDPPRFPGRGVAGGPQTPDVG
jgi:spermidine synthase